jgi:hypothetical protein
MASTVSIRNEEKALALIKELILSGSKEKLHKASATLMQSSPSTVLKLINSITNPEDTKKITDFLTLKDSLHIKQWEKLVQSKQFQGTSIVGMNGQTACSTLDQYISSHIWQKYESAKQAEEL